KMQNPRILRFLLENMLDPHIQTLIKETLKFTPHTDNEREMYRYISEQKEQADNDLPLTAIEEAQNLLRDGGRYSVNQPEFLSGANISITLTDDFMQAVKNDESWELSFSDLLAYGPEETNEYNNKWGEIGDVREWQKLGNAVTTYQKIPARELWKLITICATYYAETCIFFIDNANDQTNAVAYGQKVVATKTCGEQPLAPYSVCNL